MLSEESHSLRALYQSALTARPMSAGDFMGWLAAGLTLLAFLMRSMTALRLAAIAANLCFILYGAMIGAQPVLMLHLALLPCNLLRLCELWRSPRLRSDRG